MRSALQGRTVTVACFSEIPANSLKLGFPVTFLKGLKDFFESVLTVLHAGGADFTPSIEGVSQQLDAEELEVLGQFHRN